MNDKVKDFLFSIIIITGGLILGVFGLALAHFSLEQYWLSGTTAGFIMLSIGLNNFNYTHKKKEEGKKK